MQSAPPDIIGLVETGYAPAESDARWLGEVVVAACRFMDAGRGVIGFFFDRDQADGERCVWGVESHGADPRLVELAPAFYAEMPRPLRAQLLSGSKPVRISSALLTRGVPLDMGGSGLVREAAHTFGLRDALAVAVCDASGLGALLGAPLPAPGRIEPATRRRWAQVTGHLAAGLRLHRALHATPEPLAEAVLDPSGKVHHASGAARDRAARERLRAAVLAMERARGPLRRKDEEQALALWPALVEGRWSLVDRFESGGRRYLVAMKNDIDLPDPRALAPRERIVAEHLMLGRANKRIGYDLALGEGTVATLVARIARKLGTRSRAELVRLLNECDTSRAAIGEIAGRGIQLAIATRDEDVALGLSPREQEVARAAARGLSNEAIARSLDVAPRTVANALARVFKKLGVGSRGELARRFTPR
jgi:DNA-binding NarL/FixJ family response regulator